MGIQRSRTAVTNMLHMDARDTEVNRQLWWGLGPSVDLVKTENIEFRGYLYNAIKKVNEGKNTLVVLPTGMGKTYVAVFAAAKGIKEGRKVLLLAPTVPLVSQHLETLQSVLHDSTGVAAVTGNVLPIEHRKALERDSKVIVATPETIVSDMGNMDWSRFGYVIFDECQKTRGDYAYCKIAASLSGKGVQTIGLTATPSSRTEIVRDIQKRLGITASFVRTANDPEIVPYIMKSSTTYRAVSKSKQMLVLEDAIRSMINYNFNVLRENKLTNAESFYALPRKDFEKIKGKIEERWVDRQFGGFDFEKLGKCTTAYHKISYLSHALTLVQTEGVYPLNEYLTSLLKMQGPKRTASINELVRGKPFNDLLFRTRIAIREGHEHPKVKEILDISDFNRDKKMIVFVQYHSTMKMLAEKLGANGVNTVQLAGKAHGMNHSTQKEAISRFKESPNGTILISTQIGEEGIDVPDMPMVINYSPVPSGIRSRQRKGRTGRTSPGIVITLVTRDSRDEAYMNSSNWREKHMDNILRKMASETPVASVSGAAKPQEQVAANSPAQNQKMPERKRPPVQLRLGFN